MMGQDQWVVSGLWKKSLSVAYFSPKNTFSNINLAVFQEAVWVECEAT